MAFSLEPDFPPQKQNEAGFFLSEEDFDSCEHAVEFQAWIDGHLENLDLTQFASIYHMIILLSMQYHSWYSRVENKHRDRVDRRGHRCIFHVFIDTLQFLIDAKLKIDPAIFLPKARPTTQSPQFSPRGTLLGLEVGSPMDQIDE